MKSFYKRFLLPFIIAFTSTPLFAVDYYFYSESGGTDPLVLTDWYDLEGNTPANFESPSDNFIVYSGTILVPTASWTVGGIVTIMEGAEFRTGSISTHNLKIVLESGGTFAQQAALGSISFTSISSSSNFRYESGSFNASLPYGNLEVSTSATLNLASSISVAGNLTISSGTLNLVRTKPPFPPGQPILNLTHTIGGDIIIRNTGILYGCNGDGTANISAVNLNVQGGDFRGAALSIGGTLNMVLSGSVIQSGGNFYGVYGETSTAVSNISVGTGIIRSGGTYTANQNPSSSNFFITFNGSGNINFGTTANNNHNLIISGNYSLASNLTVGRTLTLNSGNLSIGGNTLTLNSSITINSGTLTGSTSSNITFASGSVAASLPSVTLNNLEVNRPGQIISLTGDVTVNNLLNLRDGALSIGTNTLTLNGGVTQIGGTLTGGQSSNLVISGLAANSISLPAVDLNNLTVNRNDGASLSGPVSIAGTLYLQAGHVNNSNYNFSMASGANINIDNGSLAETPNYTGTINLLYSGNNAIQTGPEIPVATNVINNFAVTKTGGVTVNQNFRVNGNITIASGALLNGGANTITLAGNWANNGTFNPGTGTITFAGNTAITGIDPQFFNNIDITAGSAVTGLAGGRVRITGDFTATETSSFNTNGGRFPFMEVMIRIFM